ncbi:hypothetical protein NLJ89_g434 [Agrocybe chaxingu]|uniref:Nucleoporin nup82 n=1 Tax=Agrocybe chaxingu TaxID=84603 RepID=A0A9W8N1W9_9AGAR|nr:hypothetical protein NLJ89_g434 [Agrocybe chaxingu]
MFDRDTMTDDDWTNLLRDHPIFSLPKSFHDQSASSFNVLELSINTLQRFTELDPEDGLTPSGRRQTMVLKDSDVIVAAGKEIRMASFGDVKLSGSARKSYKILHTPSLQFEIHQVSLNPSGKLLAVAGAFQVAVLVLPRAGYSRLVPESIDCKSVQVGQFYHAAQNSAPIAKIDWHPWGEAGSTLLVMTADGRLREYDISVDTEEPQQVLTFVPEKKSKSFMAEDDSEREVASFSFGKGRADWGPLTIYAVMKSGDIYSMCPYLPQNASVPSSYIHSLECFISAKQEFLTCGASPSTSKNLSTVYDYQRKYVNALVKQLPPGTVFPAPSRPVAVHPPTTIKAPPLRQGPFLLQPSPRLLEGSEGGDATDLAYLAFGTDDEDSTDDVRDTEHLGIVVVSYQDGKIDLFLDVEKVEARWDIKQVSTYLTGGKATVPNIAKTSSRELPMLAVYESIDLGLISMLNEVTVDSKTKSVLDLLRANHPVFLVDPLHDDMIYVYHAFGVHALDISPVLQSLSAALKEGSEDASILEKSLGKSTTTNVRPLLNTFSVERGCSNTIVAVTVPNDVYLSYSIFILTSMMRMTSFPLNIRSDPVIERRNNVAGPTEPTPGVQSLWLTPVKGVPNYVSILASEPYTIPSILANSSGLPTNPTLSLPSQPSGSKEFILTPDTLRFIGKTVAHNSAQVQEIHIAYRAAATRLALQKQELSRLTQKCRDMEASVERLKGPTRQATDMRLTRVQEEQKVLLVRLDRLLQALMEKASPELSEHETKWFDELKRMKEDVLGRGRYDESSLLNRMRLLEKEYGRILPTLHTLSEKEKARKRLEESQSLGVSQASEYGERSNIDRTRIAGIEKQISRLAAHMDLPLCRPPSDS